MDKNDILSTIEAEQVKFVELQFMDILGGVKTVSIPAKRLERAIDEGVVFDGSSIVGYATIDESDLRAYPDLDTFLIFPWSEGHIKTARMICNIYDSEGKRFEGDPRHILQNVMNKAEKMGYKLNTGPEFEFFLFKLDDVGKPTRNPDDEGGYFDLMPLDRAEKVRKECNLYFEEMGFEVEASHHECAAGQHEIDIRYGEALDIADSIMTLKHCIKTVAGLNDLHATFMPKPVKEINGSGMHIHLSLFDKNDKNVFYDPKSEDGLSKIMRYFIGGLINYSKEICAIQNSWVNSFKRLVPGYEAPVYICWSYLNRSALYRIPAGRESSTRVEVRNPDPAGNPYLQFSTLLSAGLKGIEEKINPPDPVENDIYSLDIKQKTEKGIESLPTNLGNALKVMDESRLVKETLGTHLFEHFIYKKREEWNEYRQHISKWEIDRYLSYL